MQIVGYKLTKILGEKKSTPHGNLKIDLNVSIKKAEMRSIFPKGQERPEIAFDFKFSADYGGDSELNVEGAVFGTGEEKELKKIAKDWKAKEFDPNIDALVRNRILVIGLGKIIPLAEGLSLPLPIRMPGRFVPPSETKK